MPMMVNGIGTSVCAARGHVKWGQAADFDAIECFVVLYLPLIPYKAVHTFDWNGNAYRQIPIQWSSGLVLRAFVRRWLWLPLVAAIVCAMIGIFAANEDPVVRVMLGAIAALIGISCAVCLWGLSATDGRARAVRRVLGRHDLGSSDPATWTEEVLEGIDSPREVCDTDSYGDAVLPLLAAGRYSRAMWAARLCVALEDPRRGEELTDEILGDAGVREALAEVRRNPMRWSLEMNRTMR